MITRSVTVEPIDALYLMWNDHINASALYRQALRDEMEIRGTDPHEFRDLLADAKDQGYDFEEIVAETNRYADLEQLVKQDQRTRK